MNPSKSSPLFFILFLISFTSMAAAADYELCNWLGSYYITYDTCVASLSPDPATRTADYPTLAVASLNLTIANATSVQSKLRNVSKSSPDSTAASLLNKCYGMFSRNMTSLRTAADCAAAKDYAKAGDLVFTFASMPGDCDDEFREKKGVESPLMKENLGLMDLALVAHAINDYLSKYY